jgi:hypothetical protein
MREAVACIIHLFHGGLMLKRLLFAMLFFITFPFILASAAGQEPPTPATENVKTRLDKKETIALMAPLSRMLRSQQDNKMDLILKDQSGSKTPRSDFMFCSGLAYLSNFRAQTCVAYAFEHGLGIVDDLSDAYTWYALAAENPAADREALERVQVEKERISEKLRSTYPHPSEEDLVDLVISQKDRIDQYRQDAKIVKK